MQMAVAEYARNVVRLKHANTTEIDPNTPHPVIDILPEQKKNIKEKDYGGTMRLGAYPAELKKGTVAYKAYKKMKISERHRHRYEMNPEYIEKIEKAGMVFSGKSPDRRLMEIVELPEDVHPFFVGTQFHPELQSRPLSPSPIFMKFIEASKNK
jgi:CTP synthase